MSDDYMPTTRVVRNCYMLTHNEQSSGAEFDRWLAAHDREVERAAAAKALRAYADAIGKAREIAGEMTSEWIALAMQEKARQIEEGE